jgi:hypothetical protein
MSWRSIAWVNEVTPLNARARQVIEILDRFVGEIALQRLNQHEIFARGDRQARLAKRGEKGQEHGAIKPDRRRGAKRKLCNGAPEGRSRRTGARQSRALSNFKELTRIGCFTIKITP